jgi:hypothetical protein
MPKMLPSSVVARMREQRRQEREAARIRYIERINLAREAQAFFASDDILYGGDYALVVCRILTSDSLLLVPQVLVVLWSSGYVECSCTPNSLWPVIRGGPVCGHLPADTLDLLQTAWRQHIKAISRTFKGIGDCAESTEAPDSASLTRKIKLRRTNG